MCSRRSEVTAILASRLMRSLIRSLRCSRDWRRPYRTRVGGRLFSHDEKRAQPAARANGPKRPWLICNVGQRMKVTQTPLASLRTQSGADLNRVRDLVTDDVKKLLSSAVVTFV